MSELFWRSDSCTVMVGYTPAGALQFSGYDRRAFGTPGREYEYVIEVDPDQFGALRQALGAPGAADVLAAVLAKVDDVMPDGEARWLTRHGVAHRRNVWSSPPD